MRCGKTELNLVITVSYKKSHSCEFAEIDNRLFFNHLQWLGCLQPIPARRSFLQRSQKYNLIPVDKILEYVDRITLIIEQLSLARHMVCS